MPSTLAWRKWTFYHLVVSTTLSCRTVVLVLTDLSPLSFLCGEAKEMPKPLLDRSHHCLRDDTDRVLRGTWCTPKLMEAVEQGYHIVRIYEVWHFPPHQRKRGLFAEYVSTWLKGKQESSGYPG